MFGEERLSCVPELSRISNARWHATSLGLPTKSSDCVLVFFITTGIDSPDAKELDMTKVASCAQASGGNRTSTSILSAMVNAERRDIEVMLGARITTTT